MKKPIIRREFFKLRLKNKSYSECQKEIETRFEKKLSIRTLKRWQKRLDETEWDLNDTPQIPDKLQIKFSELDKKKVADIRKKFRYGPKKTRIQAQRSGINMSLSTIKRIIKSYGLSKGSKMEGVKLKWVRFERPYPNDMWQLDGDENDDGSWRVPIEDDCSRYCLKVFEVKDLTTEAIIAMIEECIRMHGKPKQILTDNGPEFGGTSKDSQFDKWCEKQGILHIRSGVHKPTTIGKVSAIQKTIEQELPNWNNDLELWRMMYNHERPHESLRGLTPADVYFEFKRHKKHYEL